LAKIHSQNLIPDRNTEGRTLFTQSSLPRLNTVARFATSSTDIVTTTFDHTVSQILLWFDGTSTARLSFDTATLASGDDYLEVYEMTHYYLPVHTKKMYIRPSDTTATNFYYIATYKILEVT